MTTPDHPRPDSGNRADRPDLTTVPGVLPGRLPEPPICWAALPEHEYQLALVPLGVWVAWLATTYQLDTRTVPPCWRDHPNLVEDLGALHDAWKHAYRPTADPDQPIHWQHHLELATPRLAVRVARAGCRSGHISNSSPEPAGG